MNTISSDVIRGYNDTVILYLLLDDPSYGYEISFSENAENGKRRTYYQITDAGRHYYEEKCEEWQLTKDVIEHFIMHSTMEE